ncbi:MAG: metallophosphoesterase [Lachnospiraceae bacterium]|nr:metallophosphoesterase [Lachnospiraceae bacterium]
MKLRAFYGDVHGCDKEFEQLYSIVESKYPGIEHWHLGDLIDRGPNSGRSVSLAMKYCTGGVVGNHELAIIKLWDRLKKYGLYPSNEDKENTISQLTQEHIDYLKELPMLHVFDDVKLIIVHGGLFPKQPLYMQAHNQGVTNNQMIYKDPDLAPSIMRRWWGADAASQPKMNKTEEESYAEGFRRWYELYDHEYDCIYGHSVIGLEPYVHHNKGFGRTIGIDTGSCFGGYITALIYPLMEYIRIPCPEYVIGKNVRNFKNEASIVCGN